MLLSHNWILKKNQTKNPNKQTNQPLENKIQLTKTWHRKSQDGDTRVLSIYIHYGVLPKDQKSTTILGKE